jgi:ubiquinone/menaquinone biosynthesis C-methylase UbiE
MTRLLSAPLSAAAERRPLAIFWSGSYSGSIDLREMDVCNLGFLDPSFHAVATASTFCSVPKPVAGLSELRRVLKPNCQLLYDRARSQRDRADRDFYGFDDAADESAPSLPHSRYRRSVQKAWARRQYLFGRK